jgi:glucokinase
MHLVVDLGGTNTRTGLADETGLLPRTVRKTSNALFPGLAPLLENYLDEMKPDHVIGLCAGVAGPVRDGNAQLTNHNWFIEADAVRAATGAQHVCLINDLQAQGYALDDVPRSAIEDVFGHTSDTQNETRLLINLGTGCNAAVVHKRRGELFVPAAEAGHTTLPDANGAFDALYTFLRKSEPHLPVEAVLSGRGLRNIYAWQTGQDATPEEIMQHVSTEQAAAVKTLKVFIRILGDVAGNFALHHLPTGGIFLSGSVARAIAPYLDDPAFTGPFADRGPYTDIVRAIAVAVITEDSFALFGCHRYLLQSLR